MFYELASEQLEKKGSENAPLFIASAGGSNLLRAIQNCETASASCAKLRERYAGKSATNIFSALNSLINTRDDQGTEMVAYVTQLLSQLVRLAPLCYIVEVSMRVVTLLPTLNGRKRFAPMMASVHTVDETVAAWMYVERVFIEEKK